VVVSRYPQNKQIIFTSQTKPLDFQNLIADEGAAGTYVHEVNLAP
jgi:hypothetical protein